MNELYGLSLTGTLHLSQLVFWPSYGAFGCCTVPGKLFYLRKKKGKRKTKEKETEEENMLHESPIDFIVALDHSIYCFWRI